jgi:hypothetical protein
VVASRAGPPRALARFRATGELEAIPASALVLTRAEARAVARLRTRRPPPGPVLDLACGWAAGVVLLAVAAQGGPGAERAGRRSVFEYLAAEVFERVDARTREILLRTSFLPSVDANAAARLSGHPDAGDVLADLARSGWFVDALGGGRLAYRYHALFREFLAARAREALGREGTVALVRSSAALLLDAGEVDQAAALLAGAGAWDDLARVLVERAPVLAAAGRLEAMRRWLDALPEAYAEAVPWLRYWRGVSRFLSDPAGAIASAAAAFDAFAKAGDALGAWRSWAAAVDMHIHARHDYAPLDARLDALPDLSARFPFPDPQTEAAVAGTALSAFTNRRPWDPRAADWEDRAATIALAPGDARTRMDVGRHLAFRWAFWAMDLVRARVVLEALRGVATAPDADPAHALMWHFGEANYHAHVGDAASTRAVADRGLEIAARSGVHVWDSLLLTVRLFGALAAEDLASADGDLRELARVVRDGQRLDGAAYHYAAATVALRRNDGREAAERARIAARLAEEAGHPIGLAAARIAWAAAAERGGGAGPTFEEAGKAARDAGYPYGEMGVLFLAANAALARGAEGDAETLLRQALRIAGKLGCLNSVFVSRAATADLCALALERDVEPELAARIVRARSLAPGPRARCVAAWPWPVRIEALGGFALRRDGAEPPRGRAQRKPLELLRLLVAHGERGATLGTLADALWPDAEGDLAHHALETTVYRLRHILGDAAAVTLRAGRAALDPDRVFVDAWAVERLATRAEALRSRGEDEEAARTAASAAALYRGDLLADDGDPRFAPARDRLRERFLGTSRAPSN